MNKKLSEVAVVFAKIPGKAKGLDDVTGGR